MSDYIDVGEQDKALAQQIAHDQEALAAMHQNVAEHARPDRRPAPGDRRPEAHARRQPQGAQGGQGRAAEAREGDAAEPRDPAGDLRQDRPEQGGRGRRPLEAAAQPRAPARAPRSRSSSAKQTRPGNIPSEYNGTLAWPMSGNVTQNFGCTGFSRSRRRATARTSTRASTSSRRGHAGPRLGEGSSPTSAGTTPTAPTPPGS